LSNHDPALGDAPRRLPLDAAQERALLRKINWRLLPLLFFCYIIAYIDRINVGFAKLHLQDALGVDAAVFSGIYGFGAGLFFIGYFLFEVPSNLILQRVGARVWIARIMIVWGIVSAAMMFINSPAVFYSMRFLLGAAEAGFFPGVILYLTYWYPARHRARTVALFASGALIAGIVGSPLSGALLGLDGLGGLKGWQWLFVLEAMPAILLGIVVFLVLPNSPREARWLSEPEKEWVVAQVEADRGLHDPRHPHSLGQVFRSGRVWLLCLVGFLLNVGGYGYELWLPSIIKNLSGQTDHIVGWINAVPYLIAACAMIVVSRHSDRTGERRWHLALSAIASAGGFALSAVFANPYLALASLVLAFAGLKSTMGPFWAMATASLGGTAAAGGIALINSVANLGGFFGPYLVGLIKDHTHKTLGALNYSQDAINAAGNLRSLLFLGAALLGMGLLALAIRPAAARKS
jgi:MFS family permease